MHLKPIAWTQEIRCLERCIPRPKVTSMCKTIGTVAATAILVVSGSGSTVARDYRDYETVDQVTGLFRNHDAEAVSFVMGLWVGIDLMNIGARLYCVDRRLDEDQFVDIVSGYAIAHPYATRQFAIIAIEAMERTFPCPTDHRLCIARCTGDLPSELPK